LTGELVNDIEIRLIDTAMDVVKAVLISNADFGMRNAE
jgi:hypothetical protein